MTLAPGSELGPYEVVAPVGAGGMGDRGAGAWAATRSAPPQSSTTVSHTSNETVRGVRMGREYRTSRIETQPGGRRRDAAEISA